MKSIYEFNSYNIHFKSSNKFKTFYLEINFFNMHDFKRLSVREAMLRMLFMNNKIYNTSIDISKKCEDLYDPYMYYEQSLMGSYQISSLFIKFIDPKYVNPEMNTNVYNSKLQCRYPNKGIILFKQIWKEVNDIYKEGLNGQ